MILFIVLMIALGGSFFGTIQRQRSIDKQVKSEHVQQFARMTSEVVKRTMISSDHSAKCLKQEFQNIARFDGIYALQLLDKSFSKVIA